MENSYIDYNHKSIQMKNITKKFGDFVANDNINLTVHKEWCRKINSNEYLIWIIHSDFR